MKLTQPLLKIVFCLLCLFTAYSLFAGVLFTLKEHHVIPRVCFVEKVCIE